MWDLLHNYKQYYLTGRVCVLVREAVCAESVPKEQLQSTATRRPHGKLKTNVNVNDQLHGQALCCLR
jgi:hypothetical protein